MERCKKGRERSTLVLEEVLQVHSNIPCDEQAQGGHNPFRPGSSGLKILYLRFQFLRLKFQLIKFPRLAIPKQPMIDLLCHGLDSLYLRGSVDLSLDVVYVICWLFHWVPDKQKCRGRRAWGRILGRLED